MCTCVSVNLCIHTTYLLQFWTQKVSWGEDWYVMKFSPTGANKVDRSRNNDISPTISLSFSPHICQLFSFSFLLNLGPFLLLIFSFWPKLPPSSSGTISCLVFHGLGFLLPWATRCGWHRLFSPVCYMLLLLRVYPRTPPCAPCILYCFGFLRSCAISDCQVFFPLVLPYFQNAFSLSLCSCIPSTWMTFTYHQDFSVHMTAFAKSLLTSRQCAASVYP